MNWHYIQLTEPASLYKVLTEQDENTSFRNKPLSQKVKLNFGHSSCQEIMIRQKTLQQGAHR